MSEHATISVMIVDDHALFREGVASLIRSQADMHVVSEANDGLEALVMAQNLRPNVILMDINMPGMDGLEATRLIAQALPESQILMLTMRDEDARIFEAVQRGAHGYLLKTIRAQQLTDAIRAAARGETELNSTIASRVIAEFRRLGAQNTVPQAEPDSEIEALTFREHEVLGLIAEGQSDKQIAIALTISLYTVKAHVRNILAKLHVNSRREAALRSRRSS